MIWNGWGYNSNYDELNIVPSLEYEINDFEFYISYNRKQFLPQGTFDNEIGSGVSYGELPYNISLAFDWYHSFATDGSFFEFSLGTEINPVQHLTIQPAIVLGINENYISDGHDGTNHLSLQLDGEYELARNFNLLGNLAYNIAIDSDPATYAGDASLKSFIWGGIGFEILF